MRDEEMEHEVTKTKKYEAVASILRDTMSYTTSDDISEKLGMKVDEFRCCVPKARLLLGAMVTPSSLARSCSSMIFILT